MPRQIPKKTRHGDDAEVREKPDGEAIYLFDLASCTMENSKNYRSCFILSRCRRPRSVLWCVAGAPRCALQLVGSTQQIGESKIRLIVPNLTHPADFVPVGQMIGLVNVHWVLSALGMA